MAVMKIAILSIGSAPFITYYVANSTNVHSSSLLGQLPKLGRIAVAEDATKTMHYGISHRMTSNKILTRML
jgi:hypothetical protein